MGKVIDSKYTFLTTAPVSRHDYVTIVTNPTSGGIYIAKGKKFVKK